jgi:hypothetical protein
VPCLVVTLSLARICMAPMTRGCTSSSQSCENHEVFIHGELILLSQRYQKHFSFHMNERGAVSWWDGEQSL